MTSGAASRAGMALVGLVIATAADIASAQDARSRIGIVGTSPRTVSEGVLDLLAYSVVPDGTVNTLQLDRSGEGDNDIGVRLSQLGAGFTWSESSSIWKASSDMAAMIRVSFSATVRSSGASPHDGTRSARPSGSATTSVSQRTSTCAPS